MEATRNTANGNNLKKIRLKRITSADLTRLPRAGAQNLEMLYGPIYWANPYLLFLILILLLLSFSPTPAWTAYVWQVE